MGSMGVSSSWQPQWQQPCGHLSRLLSTALPHPHLLRPLHHALSQPAARDHTLLLLLLLLLLLRLHAVHPYPCLASRVARRAMRMRIGRAEAAPLASSSLQRAVPTMQWLVAA